MAIEIVTEQEFRDFHRQQQRDALETLERTKRNYDKYLRDRMDVGLRVYHWKNIAQYFYAAIPLRSIPMIPDQGTIPDQELVEMLKQYHRERKT